MNPDKAPRPAAGMVRYAQMMHTAAGKLKYTQETLDRATLDDLLRATPPEVHKKAADVHIVRRFYETGTSDGFKRTYVKYPSTYNQVRVYTKSSQRLVKTRSTNKKTKKEQTHTAPSGSGKQHLSIIRFYGPPKGNSPCWVWCDCEYMTYTLEVALKDLGSSSVKNSNGEDPDIRNPMKIGYLCKHLVAAAQWAKNLDKDLANEKYQKEEAKEADKKATDRKLKRFR